ncbi:MAG: HNH endonuclease, partial [Gordonia sp. (in: high G+C Gram-positive bacteria)]
MAANQAVALPDDPAELAALSEAVIAKLATAAFTASTEGQLLETAEILERANRRFDGATSALLAEISDRSAYRKAGFLSLHAYLAGGLRLGDGEAKRRRITGAGIARLANLQGETL